MHGETSEHTATTRVVSHTWPVLFLLSVALLMAAHAGTILVATPAIADESLRLKRNGAGASDGNSNNAPAPATAGRNSAKDEDNLPDYEPATEGGAKVLYGNVSRAGATGATNETGAQDNSGLGSQRAKVDLGARDSFKIQVPPAVDVTDQRRHPQESNARELSVQDRTLLAQHDVVLIIDKSGSMSAHDCPLFGGLLSNVDILLNGGYAGRISRWDWCFRQVLALGKETDDLFPSGITVVVFSDRFTIFKGVHLKAIPEIFAENRPSGGTLMAEPLAAVFGDYFARKAANPSTKPLVVAIVTDGLPNFPVQFEQVLAAASRQVHDPRELTVTMLQIGPSVSGFAKHLVDESKTFGAAYEIMHTKTFSQLAHIGLSRAIVDALVESN